MFKTNAMAEPVLSVLLAYNRTLLCIITEYIQATQNVTYAFKDQTESSVQNNTLPCTEPDDQQKKSRIPGAVHAKQIILL